jgi:hypothetical protein
MSSLLSEGECPLCIVAVAVVLDGLIVNFGPAARELADLVVTGIFWSCVAVAKERPAN